MSRHDDRMRLMDMRDHGQEACALCAQRCRADLDMDRLLALSVVRLLEVVGEAAARTSPATRSAIPGIPWSQIIAMRNRLIHAYAEVDLNIVWTVINRDLPPMIAEINAHLNSGPA